MNHKNLLQLVFVDQNSQDFTTKAYFKYPNEDLFGRKTEIVESKTELMKFLGDILEALTILERNGIVHGNVRPEYIFYDDKT